MQFIRVVILGITVCHLLLFPAAMQAQEKQKREFILLHPDKFYRKFFPNLKIKPTPLDTTYIKVYPNYLSAGVRILSPAIQTSLSPRKKIADGYDASSTFKTNVADIVGFAASYRFVSFGFAFLLNSGMNTNNDYAASRYRTATIKYNSAAYTWQFRYLRIRGFTDVNQANRMDTSLPYVQRPDMVNKEFQFEGLYNFSWRKYSYVALMNFSQRQIKSRAGFLIKGGVYYDQLSGESSLISQRQRPYYDGFEDITAIRSLSVRIAPGAGGTLVLHRHVYLAAAIFPSCDLYLYKYLEKNTDKTSGKQTVAFVFDGAMSIGYQSKRLYAGVRYEAERRAASLNVIATRASYDYMGIEVGYRFDAPAIVKKVYRKTMPPGM